MHRAMRTRARRQLGDAEDDAWVEFNACCRDAPAARAVQRLDRGVQRLDARPGVDLSGSLS